MSVHTLVSHPLCPYVQRAVIVLKEKGIDFTRRDVDLTNLPAWFLELSPLAKTPVMLVDDEPIFESAVICEFWTKRNYRPCTRRTRLNEPDTAAGWSLAPRC